MVFRWPIAERQPRLFGDERVTHPEFAGVEFIHVRARRIINTLRHPGPLPFRHTINVYRGCTHACVYCFARPTHSYLDLDPAEDFERVIVVKVNAPERLDAELAAPTWTGERIAMGTNTDPYQRCEGRYQLTRQVIEVLLRHRNPFSILTKSPLVLRDLDLLRRAAEVTEVRVDLSVATLDEEVWRATEPGTPHPRARLEAVAELRRAGIPSSVLVAPIIPGLSDRPAALRAVADAARAAGAEAVVPIALHLRGGTKELFHRWLAAHRPDLLPMYERLYGSGSELPLAVRRRLAAEVSGSSAR